jgi:hypothetical protein
VARFGQLQEVLGDQGGKQEVARGAQGASTQLLELGDNVTILQRAPGFWEVFWKFLNNNNFACVGDSNLLQKL